LRGGWGERKVGAGCGAKEEGRRTRGRVQGEKPPPNAGEGGGRDGDNKKTGRREEHRRRVRIGGGLAALAGGQGVCKTMGGEGRIYLRRWTPLMQGV